jgi:selT/selW/selH-like putative selenoprotein
LAAVLSRKLGIEAELLEGDRGAFDVVADGRLIFSKHTAHRFPDSDEIVRALKTAAPE